MDNEENESKPLLENKVIHVNTHVLTKQINHLLKILNPQIKNSNLNAHFYQLIQTLITQAEFIEFDLQIKMKNICMQLEKCISNSKATLFFFDPAEKIVTYYAAPSMPETFHDFYQEYNQSENKISAPFEYNIRVSNISEDRLWEPYYHHFEKLGLKSCWTIPVYRTPKFICSFAIYTKTYKNPVSNELHCIHEKRNHINKLICKYPVDFATYWTKGMAKSD